MSRVWISSRCTNADPPLRVREDPEDEIEDGEYSDLVEIDVTE